MKENNIEILLVEDNPADADLTIRALKKRHLANNLLHLSDGAQAIDFLLAQGEFHLRDITQVPKIVLLDLKMPKMNGIDVLRNMRADVRTAKIPVVVLTSSKEDTDVELCYNLGVNSYIVKPVEFDKFFNVVSELGLYWVLLNNTAK
jgi:two-component system, response regulator